MVDTSSLLGSVEVEVKANLDKLVADFARGKVQTQQFARDMGQVTAQTKLSAAEQLSLAQSYNRLIQTYDPLKDKMNRYRADLQAISKINQSGMFSPTELARLNSGVAAFAKTNKDFASLLGGVAPPAKRAKEAVKDLGEEVERQGVHHANFVRSMERSIRAVRLFAVVFGAEMVGRLGEFLINTLQTTAALKYQAEQLGLTTRELQEYHAIARQVGMSAEDMDSAFATLGKNLEDLSLGRVGPFSKLMVKLFGDAKAAALEAKKPISEVFLDMIDKLGRVGNEAQQRGAQVLAFGEAGSKMGTLVEQGSSGITTLREAVRATGMVLSDEQIQQADQTAKKLDQVKQVLSVKFASTVVANAGAISTMADALGEIATISLERIIQSIGALIERIEQFIQTARDVRNFLSQEPGGPGGMAAAGPDRQIHAFSEFLGSYNYGRKPSTGLIGQALRAVGLESGPPPSTTVKLPPARPADAKPTGSNIDLSGILSPKAPKGARAKYDQFEQQLAQEKERQLELEKDATGSLIERNRIEKEIIDLNLTERIEQIKRMVHNKELTAKEGRKLTAEAEATAALEKEAADRKMRIAQIEQANQYADEMERLELDALEVDRALARTDEQRKRIELAILDSKQRQAVAEIDKEIAIAREQHDEERIAELTEERKKLLENQAKEIRQFAIEHLTGIEKFKHDLPATVDEINDAISRIRFDLFTERLQRAANMARSIGDAFGRAAGAIARFENPMDVLTGLLQDLAQTLTENVIEKPVSDFFTQRLGIPMAKQAFGKDLTGPDALTVQQMNVALGMATQNLHMLEIAAQQAAFALGSAGGAGAGAGAAAAADALGQSATGATSALNQQVPAINQFGSSLLSVLSGLAGGGGGGGFLGAALNIAGAALGSVAGGGGGASAASAFGGGPGGFLMGGESPFTVSGPLAGSFGFAGGGFTGSGPDDEIAGVVHRNEWVWDADTTRELRPLLAMIGTGRIPGFGGTGLMERLGGGQRHLHAHFGDIHVHGAKDDRSARRSGRQALGVIQRGISQVVRSGINK